METEKLPIVPAMKPPAWPARAEALCRPLAALPGVSNVPWVGFGYQHPDSFEFFTLQSFPGADPGDSLRLIENAAMRSLRERQPAWRLERVQLGLLRRMPLLILSDDALAAEQIINRGAMRRAAQMLRCQRIAVSIPRRGVLVATSARLSRSLMNRFIHMVAGQYATAHGQALSPAIFFLEDGEITGGMSGMQVEAKDPAASQDPFIEAMITADRATGSETLRILAGCADFDRLCSELTGTFLRAASQMAQRAAFSGAVIVTLIPELTPNPRDLPAAVARLEESLRKAAVEAGISAPDQKEIQVQVLYGSTVSQAGGEGGQPAPGAAQ